MELSFINLKAYYLPTIFGAGVLSGLIFQTFRVRYYRQQQIKAEQEKLKMQAHMLGLGHLYDTKDQGTSVL
ncbi:MAG: hypothetical protein V4722_27875 [Bacteroidota bacterium]